jgi:hypothetical protein
MILGNISAQAMDCHDLGLEKEYTLLKKLNRSKNNDKAILLADSLLTIISKNGKSTCKLRFQIEIEKGESLELQSKYEDAMNLYYNLIRNAEPLTYWDMVAKAHISLARIQEFIDREIVVMKKQRDQQYSINQQQQKEYQTVLEEYEKQQE